MKGCDWSVLNSVGPFRDAKYKPDLLVLPHHVQSRAVQLQFIFKALGYTLTLSCHVNILFLLEWNERLSNTPATVSRSETW